MANFKPYDYKQSSMIVINFEDQLQPGTFEHAVHHLIENKLDLSIFDSAYHNDETGRPAYDPALLLKIILFAYSKGITSSRQIQWCCETNVIFKALACDYVPHFTTIADFISSRSKEIEMVFEQVLLVCHEQGLLGNELFAIDGCKMPSNAAKEWSGTLKELTAKRDKIKRLIRHHTKAHQQIDKSESHEEEKVITAKTVKTLNKAFERIDKFLKTASPRMGKGKKPKEVKSNITDNESCKATTSKGTIQGYNGIATVDKKHQIIVDAQAFGEGQEHHTLNPVIGAVAEKYQRLGIEANLFKTGAVFTADTGFANEANMQYLHDKGIKGHVPDNKFRSRDPRFQDYKKKYPRKSRAKKTRETLYSASEFHFDPMGINCRCPMGEELSFRSIRHDEEGNKKAYFEGKLLQCRHCKQKHRCMKNPESADHRKGNGRQVSFILESKDKVSYTQWMKERVDSELGKEIYGHRMSVVEPVFGNIGSNKGLNEFSLRGKDKVQGQWCLYCTVHNIEKLCNYGHMVH